MVTARTTPPSGILSFHKVISFIFRRCDGGDMLVINASNHITSSPISRQSVHILRVANTALLPDVTERCSPSWELELRPLGVATGNALSVTRSEDTYVKTPPVGRRQPMTSLPACHNINAAGRIHHQLFRLH